MQPQLFKPEIHTNDRYSEMLADYIKRNKAGVEGVMLVYNKKSKQYFTTTGASKSFFENNLSSPFGSIKNLLRLT